MVAVEVDHKHALQKAAGVLLRKAVFDPPFGRRLTRPLYWTVTPIVWRRWYSTDLDDWTASPDPFKIERVDPRRIRRFTPRVYPPFHRRRELFGAVKGGDWDRQSGDEIPLQDGPPMDLYHAERIEQGSLYRAIESHFVDDVPWEDTEFVRGAIEYLNDGVEWVWHDCSSRRDVMDRCRWLDELHRSMRRHGCLDYRERVPASEREKGFLHHMENEIVVDVGRAGELLLVSGKHRYCLAHVIGLDEIPVTFLVRHAEWMETRCGVARNGGRDLTAATDDHPDLRDIDESGPVGGRGQ